MTEPPLVLDADFVSSFAWVDRLDILESLYSKRMIVLDEVINELNRVPHIARRVRLSVGNSHIECVSMFADTPEALELGRLLEDGRLGTGEAACMAYLKHHDGTLGSNNLSDVKRFCIDNNKCLLTTADALYEAYKAGLIGLEEADKIWSDMISKRRKLPAPSFSNYMSTLKQG